MLHALQLETLQTRDAPGPDHVALCIAGFIMEFSWVSAGRAPGLTNRTRGSGLHLSDAFVSFHSSEFKGHQFLLSPAIYIEAEFVHTVDLMAAQTPRGFSKEERTCLSGPLERPDAGQARGQGVSAARSSPVLSPGRVATRPSQASPRGHTEEGSSQDPF